MRLRTTRIGAVSILLILFGSAFAQQAVDESKIVQMRATVQKIEGLIGDTNIPAETRQHLSEVLFEKRGELHALLRQKRDSLRSNLENTTSATELSNLNKTIQQLNREMQQLSGASAAESVASQPSAAGSDVTVPTNGTEPAAPIETVNAGETVNVRTPTSEPVAPSPAPPAAGSTVPSTLTSSAASVSNQPALAQQAPDQQPGVPPDAQNPCANLAAGPAPPDVEYRRQIQAAACRMLVARTPIQGVAGNPAEAQINFQAYNFLIALAIARAHLPRVAIPELTAQAENASHAKNVGADGSSAGSTSLASKAGLPAIFGFAVENGALAKAINGTTVTFTGNPVGLVQSMAKRGFIDSYQTQDGFTKFLRKLSFGLSFDTSRGAQAGTFTADRQQLSGFSFKYNIVDQRDPRDSRHTARWQAITKKQATNLALALNNFVRGLATPPGSPALNAWIANANQALVGKTSFTDIESTLETELDKLGSLQLPPDMEAMVKQVGTDFDAFLEERNDILGEISNGWIATLDYNNERPLGSPTLSNFRFLAEKGAYNGSIDFTGNASLTFYNSRPTTPNTQRLRDFRFAGQLDVPIGDITKTGKFLLSFAGRYQRLLNDETIPGTAVVVRKGDIAVGQLKLTIPIRGTALKFPLSITFANRTELIQEKEVRGNFGVTFDLDSILAKFNPFTKQ